MKVIDEHDLAVYQGDVREQLAALPAGSVQCCVTSPPYYGLRDYGVDGQIGLEASPAEYVAEMVGVFREVRRVLADDGVLWLNIGDSYSGNLSSSSRSAASMPSSVQGCRSSAASNSEVGTPGASSLQYPADSSLSAQEGQYPSHPSPNSENSSSHSRQVAMSRSVGPLADMKQGARNGHRRSRPRGYEGFAPKNLLGIPWRVAFGLQDDGWTLRNAVIWHKPNAMPESVTDRLSCRYEHVFLFSKSRRYWFDLDAIREPHAETTIAAAARARKPYLAPGQRPHSKTSGRADLGANPGDVWGISTQPFPGAHFACMPPALAERCILAGCPEGGTVLDPFAGSGTTLMVARKLARRSVGVELNPAYIAIIRERIGQTPLDFGTEVPA